MKASNVSVITPVLTKDVSFNEKVETVDTALKSRAAAQREIKMKWAAIVKLLQKYDLSVPARRPDPSTVVSYIKSVQVYVPKPEVAEEMKAVVECDGRYELERLAEKPDLLKMLDNKFTGFGSWLDKVREAKRIIVASKKVDEEATKAAKAEMSAAVDAYLTSIEAYDETIESVANVKEYIGIMKEIADISAIAQGVKARE